MGREFELKYTADPARQAAISAAYPHLRPISMETTYYDTPDHALGQRHWTVRRRLENGRSVCTVKTPAPGGGRGEWEVEMADIAAAIPQLCRMGAPAELENLASAGLKAVCGARFTRLAGLIQAPGCTVELALDAGVLLAGSRETSLCEVEVELKSGDEDAAVAFAQTLAERFHLTPQPKSKYRRALDLAQEI